MRKIHLLFIALCVACNYDNVTINKPTAKSFEWVVSELSPPSGSFFQFSIDDDNALHALGFLGGDYGVYKWSGSSWSSIAKLKWDSLNIQSFAVLKQKVYLVNFISNEQNSLLRAQGSILENIPVSGRPTLIAQINGKLIIVGGLLDANNASYGIGYSTDGTSFIRLSPKLSDPQFVAPGFSIDIIENRMFIGDSKGKTFEFDGELKFFRDKTFKLVDQQNDYYWISNELNGYQVEKTTNEDLITVLGQKFGSSEYPLFLFLKDNTVISINDRSGLALNSTYYFDGTDWQPINTTNYFSNAFKYNDKVFANCVGGLILELVAK